MSELGVNGLGTPRDALKLPEVPSMPIPSASLFVRSIPKELCHG